MVVNQRIPTIGSPVHAIQGMHFELGNHTVPTSAATSWIIAFATNSATTRVIRPA